ncbi:MAG TPA: hypothetical protein ENJ84_14790 [Gammaproteobacteria bacterium]|nr:hypothetical protein [Gammaproteobacteria bacterium]
MHTLAALPSPVINHASLVAMLDDYARPNDKISALISSRALLPLKRGLYLVAGVGRQSLELIANHLVGPSYISRYWALAYYGLLSERVSVITSMCLNRSRQLDTEMGVFHYQAIPAAYYSVGINSIEKDGIAFMMATPEKALADLLVSTRQLRIQSQTAMLSYLNHDLRLDEDELTTLDVAQLYSIAGQGYKTLLLTHLAKTIEGLSHD